MATTNGLKFKTWHWILLSIAALIQIYAIILYATNGNVVNDLKDTNVILQPIILGVSIWSYFYTSLPTILKFIFSFFSVIFYVSFLVWAYKESGANTDELGWGLLFILCVLTTIGIIGFLTWLIITHS